MEGFEVTDLRKRAVHEPWCAVRLHLGCALGRVHNADEASQFYEMEMESDEHSERTDTPRKKMSKAENHDDDLEDYGGGSIEARTDTFRYGCWSSTSCSSYGASITPTLLGRPRAWTDSGS